MVPSSAVIVPFFKRAPPFSKESIFESLCAGDALGAVVKIFFVTLPFAEAEGVELAGCLRFRELDEVLPSSPLAENEEVPGMESLAAGDEVAPFTAGRFFRELEDGVAFSPSGLEPLTVALTAVPDAVRFADLEEG